MFFITRPSPRQIEDFLRTSKRLPLSYAPVGLARGRHGRFCHDYSSVVLGAGDGVFERAWTALRSWRQFDIGWAEVFANGEAIAPGLAIAVLIRHLGFWSLNGGRVLYMLEDDDRAWNRGYAYGTLINHAERGEEIFKIAMDRETREVTYSIHAASRPRSPLVWCGYPIARTLQRRFRLDSLLAMQRAVG